MNTETEEMLSRNLKVRRHTLFQGNEWALERLDELRQRFHIIDYRSVISKMNSADVSFIIDKLKSITRLLDKNKPNYHERKTMMDAYQNIDKYLLDLISKPVEGNSP